MSPQPTAPPLRRTLTLLNLAMLLCAGGWFGCDPREKPRAPRVQFETTMLDLGKVKPGEALHAVFNLENRGDLPLILENVRGGCDVEAQVQPGSTVAAKRPAQIVVSLTAPSDPGEQLQTVSVYANDPLQMVTLLTIRTHVTP